MLPKHHSFWQVCIHTEAAFPVKLIENLDLICRQFQSHGSQHLHTESGTECYSVICNSGYPASSRSTSLHNGIWVFPKQVKQQVLLSSSYQAQMQGDKNSRVMSDLVPTSLLTVMIPTCSLPLPPKASGAITLHPEGTEWQPRHPWQDLSRWSSFQSLAAEGARCQAQEMELDMMHPAYIDNLAGCSTWQHNSAYEVKATSPSFLGEVIPHVNDGWQKIMAPTPAWGTFKHMRAGGVRQPQQLEENNNN